MSSLLTHGRDVLLALSNLFFIIPAITAIRQGRWTRSIVFFLMCIASFLYHLCDSFDACLFSAQMHHYLDFFFAQFLIVLTGLYFIDFKPRYQWIERWLIILGAVAIVVMQITLGADLEVQAVLVGVIVLGVLLYWYFRGGLPDYHILYLSLGLNLIVLSVSLYTYQNMEPTAYWGLHSLWHMLAAIGQHYFLYIKPGVSGYLAADARIRYRRNK